VLLRSGSKDPFLLKLRAPADGWDLLEVVAALDRETREPVVAFRIDSLAAGRFVHAIGPHVGEPLAIVLDGEIIALPIIAEPLDRSVRISGGLTAESANELAMLMRAGIGMPVKLIVVEEQIIAPRPAK